MEHSTPVKEYPKLTELSKGHSVPLAVPTDIKEPDASPSIHLLVKGKSFLSNELGVDDNEESILVDKFMNLKLKSSGLKDSPDNYREMLEGMAKQLGITKNHEGKITLSRIYNHLVSGKLASSDKMILLSLLIGENNARK